MPLAGRVVAAVVGVLLILSAWYSLVGTIIVPRAVGSWLTRWVDKIVSFSYRVLTDMISDHKRRDRVLATQAAAILLTQHPVAALVDRKSTRLNSSHITRSRMPSSA